IPLGLARYHQAPVPVEPVSAERREPRAGGRREPFDRVEVDAHVDLRGDLVHVLAARARGAHGPNLHRPLGHTHHAVHDDRAAHASIVSRAIVSSPRTAVPHLRHLSGPAPPLYLTTV